MQYWDILILKKKKKYLFCFVFVFLYFSGAAPMAHGGSQARGPIGATVAGLQHTITMPDPSRVCELHHSSADISIDVYP